MKCWHSKHAAAPFRTTIRTDGSTSNRSTISSTASHVSNDTALRRDSLLNIVHPIDPSDPASMFSVGNGTAVAPFRTVVLLSLDRVPWRSGRDLFLPTPRDRVRGSLSAGS